MQHRNETFVISSFLTLGRSLMLNGYVILSAGGVKYVLVTPDGLDATVMPANATDYQARMGAPWTQLKPSARITMEEVRELTSVPALKKWLSGRHQSQSPGVPVSAHRTAATATTTVTAAVDPHDLSEEMERDAQFYLVCDLSLGDRRKLAAYLLPKIPKDRKIRELARRFTRVVGSVLRKADISLP